MIIPKLWARLGNQCFQIAAAIAHAKKMNTKWAVPRQTLDPRIWPIYFNGLPTLPTMHAPYELYKEKRHSFDCIPDKDKLILEGYFQSEKYFENAKNDIGNALGFRCNKQDYIAVHVRRGDYLQYEDQFPVLPLDYYREAMEVIGAFGEYSKFKIYSDDIKWCRQNITRPGLNINWMVFNDPLIIEYCEIKDPLTAMCDMYNAAGFIIANSTFSLFPALLRLDNPVTIAPAENRWYGPKNSHLETCDLMPERFIKI